MNESSQFALFMLNAVRVKLVTTPDRPRTESIEIVVGRECAGLIGDVDNLAVNMVPVKFESLNASQRKAMVALVVEDRNVMVLGEAGTGKSALIKNGCGMYLYRRRQEGKKLLGSIVTAPFGMAASKLQGRTIDSLFPQLTNISDPEKCTSIVKKLMATNPDRWKHIKNLSILVIDEVSTLLVTKLRMLDVAFRIIRDAPLLFMGGVRLLLCGDFLQLDSTGGAEDTKLYGHEMMIEGQFKIINLTQNLRQTDEVFGALLSRARLGRLTSEDDVMLQSRSFQSVSDADIDPSSLQICGTRNLAHIINTKRFASLEATSLTYVFTAIKRWKIATDEEEKWIVKSVDAENPVGALREKLKEFCFRPCVMETKRCTIRIGARVMLNRNLYDYKDNRMRNGRLGTVVNVGMVAEQCDEEPLLSPLTYVGVSFDDDEPGVMVKVKPAVLRHGAGEVWCMPLVHAWAVTVHKAQGCEVDKLAVHCSDLYRPKQLYVAISRCRTLSGLTLLNYEGSLMCPPAAAEVRFYDAVQQNGGMWDFCDGQPKEKDDRGRNGSKDKASREIKKRKKPQDEEMQALSSNKKKKSPNRKAKDRKCREICVA
ncbi:hypothetical protein CYMTET_3005 [Cymbomonas tetramitiformis]|uniref:ATP-dependent DNA helicase n=1 Tax=Cymbomonas tetramitiformis TaxID=36881 RepID=A0AAE0H429_9CHLO|nr:hypothetical protein CYMTET_3005 [Cymbomonas tetramitiformis]|eukprot:gene248-438_t